MGGKKKSREIRLDAYFHGDRKSCRCYMYWIECTSKNGTHSLTKRALALKRTLLVVKFKSFASMTVQCTHYIHKGVYAFTWFESTFASTRLWYRTYNNRLWFAWIFLLKKMELLLHCCTKTCLKFFFFLEGGILFYLEIYKRLLFDFTVLIFASLVCFDACLFVAVVGVVFHNDDITTNVKFMSCMYMCKKYWWC